MLIQELSNLTNTSKDTIRYYEKIGVLPKSSRNSNGYRHYDEKSIMRLKMVQVGKDLGFSLNEIKELSNLLYSNRLTPKTMAKKLEQKLDHIDDKINSLKSIKKEIKNALKGNCEYRGFLSK